MCDNPSQVAVRFPLALLSAALVMAAGCGKANYVLAPERQVNPTDWPEAMALVASSGPAEVVRRVRQAEARHAVAADDATISYCTGFDGS